MATSAATTSNASDVRYFFFHRNHRALHPRRGMQRADDAEAEGKAPAGAGGRRGSPRARYWLGTSFSTDAPAFADLRPAPRYWVCQREATADGRRHWQFYLEFSAARARDALARELGGNPHLESRRGTRDQARAYCRKPCDRSKEAGSCSCEPRCPRDDPPFQEGGRWELESGRRSDWDACKAAIAEGASFQELARGEFTDLCAKHREFILYLIGLQEAEAQVPVLLPDQHPWQRQVLEELKQEPHRRNVNWYYEETGQTGKTVFAEHLFSTRGALILEPAKKADLNYILANTEPRPSIIIFDIPRNAMDHMDHLYSILESIKDGRILSTKYQCKQVRFPACHLYVFANFAPNPAKLSEDRLRSSTWQILPDLSCIPHFNPRLVRAAFVGNMRPREDVIDLSQL